MNFGRMAGAGAAICALVLAGCSSAGDIQANGAETITLTVGHDQWIGYSAMFLAQDQGYFTEAGLDVELKPFSNPGETLTAVTAGQLDIGMTTLQNLAILGGNGNTDTAAIAFVDSSNGADAIVATEDIKSLSDLQGKTVGLTQGEVNQFLFLAAMKHAGVDPGTVKIANMSADDAGAAFIAGRVDAAVTWEPWVTKATEQGGNVLFTSAGIPDTIIDSVVVQRDKLSENKETYLDFITAIDRGAQFLKSNPDEAAGIVGEYLDASPEDVKGMLAGDTIYSLEDNERLFGTEEAPGPAYASMQSVVDFAVESGLITTAPSVENLLDPSLIRDGR